MSRTEVSPVAFLPGSRGPLTRSETGSLRSRKRRECLGRSGHLAALPSVQEQGASECPPQLSREYRRMLGAPPRQDVAALKVASQPGIAPAFNVTVRLRAPDLRHRRLFQPRCRRRKSLLTTGEVDREPRPLASSVPISSRRSTKVRACAHRSDDTDARREARRCVGRSGRSALVAASATGEGVSNSGWVKWTPNTRPLDRGQLLRPLPVSTEGMGTIPDQMRHHSQESITEAPRSVHGRAKTSAGRSGIPSFAFHAVA
jgi:hypothetical protein